MIPVPEINESSSAGFRPFEPPRLPRAASAPAGDVELGALLRFKTLMAADGQEVHLTRLCHDKLYAYERIAAAHAGGSEELRRLALELFQIYHRRPAGLPAQ